MESPTRPFNLKINSKMKNFDIQQHTFVPKHIRLNKKEAEKLLKNYNISTKQLPKISHKDPIVKALNAKPDEIIKIIRKSPTAGESIFYRVVVNE